MNCEWCSRTTTLKIFLLYHFLQSWCLYHRIKWQPCQKRSLSCHLAALHAVGDEEYGWIAADVGAFFVRASRLFDKWPWSGPKYEIMNAKSQWGVENQPLQRTGNRCLHAILMYFLFLLWLGHVLQIGMRMRHAGCSLLLAIHVADRRQQHNSAAALCVMFVCTTIATFVCVSVRRRERIENVNSTTRKNALHTLCVYVCM